MSERRRGRARARARCRRRNATQEHAIDRGRLRAPRHRDAALRISVHGGGPQPRRFAGSRDAGDRRRVCGGRRAHEAADLARRSLVRRAHGVARRRRPRGAGSGPDFLLVPAAYAGQARHEARPASEGRLQADAVSFGDARRARRSRAARAARRVAAAREAALARHGGPRLSRVEAEPRAHGRRFRRDGRGRPGLHGLALAAESGSRSAARSMLRQPKHGGPIMVLRSTVAAAALLSLLLSGCDGVPSAEDAAQAAALETRIAALERRKERIEDVNAIERLQHAYGYYADRGLWDEAANLFADDGTIEIGLDGVYLGRERVRQYLRALSGGRPALTD